MSAEHEKITLSRQDLEQRLWHHDATHLGFAMTPLFQSFMAPALAQALNDLIPEGKEGPGFETRVYHGYIYVASPPGQGKGPTVPSEAMKEEFANIRPRFDRIIAEEILPQYEAIERMAEAIQTPEQAASALETLNEMYVSIWKWHMRIVRPAFSAQEMFEALYLERFPDKRAVDAHELLAGLSNKFVETDRELARLATRARRSPEVRAAILQKDAWQALQEEPKAREFLEELCTFTHVYGWRVGASHDFYERTWIEDPSPALAVIRQFMESGYDFDAEWAATVRHRQAALKDALASLANADDRARFEEAYQFASQARPLDEDHHFYIDAMLPAKCRGLLLRVAEILVGQGAIAQSQEVFFLYRQEVIELLRGSSAIAASQVADQRYQEYRWYREETPSESLGQAPQEQANSEAPSEASQAAGTLRGLSASAGSWQGTARVLHGPEDFSKLQSGDVLIARTTTPVWSSLFAVAGAVVTDAGGILSHAATVAREYRVPCVVATKTATRVICDGDQVLVDGDQGFVQMMGSTDRGSEVGIG